MSSSSLTPLAHQTWFYERPPDGDSLFVFEPLTLAYLAAAVGVVLVFRLLARRRAGVDVPFLARLAPWMPFAIRVHLGISLIGLLSGGYWLSPAMELEPDVFGFLLGAAMAAVGVLLFAGWNTRAAALALVVLGPIGMLEFGVLPVLQRVDVLGLALFLLFSGPGRWSADLELGREREVPPIELGRAIWVLRVAAGVALIVVAYVEKLGNPEFAQAFLTSQEIELNVPAALGFPVSDLEFVRAAGAIEVLFGLLLISGALPQAVVIAAGIPFNVTLFFYGTNEMLGHLPVYGTMLVLLVWGSDPRLRPCCSVLWPWGSGGRRQEESERAPVGSRVRAG